MAHHVHKEDCNKQSPLLTVELMLGKPISPSTKLQRNYLLVEEGRATSTHIQEAFPELRAPCRGMRLYNLDPLAKRSHNVHMHHHHNHQLEY